MNENGMWVVGKILIMTKWTDGTELKVDFRGMIVEDFVEKIPVTSEGREGVYLITPDDAIEFVKTLKGKIHNFIGNGGMMLGADWSKKEVVNHLKEDGLRIAILTAPNLTMKHHLVTITPEGKRYSFDVGELTPNDLEAK